MCWHCPKVMKCKRHTHPTSTLFLGDTSTRQCLPKATKALSKLYYTKCILPVVQARSVLRLIHRSNVEPKCGNNMFLVSPCSFVVLLFRLSLYRLQTVVGPCSTTYCEPAKQYFPLEVGLASLYPLKGEVNDIPSLCEDEV